MIPLSWIRHLLCRRRDRRVSLQRRTPRPTPGQRDAARARLRAQLALEQARQISPLVSEVAALLRQARTENHFAERIRASMEDER